MRRVGLISLLMAMFGAAPALAQDPPAAPAAPAPGGTAAATPTTPAAAVTTPAPPTTTTPTPPPPAAGTITLGARRVLTSGKRRIALTGRSFTVRVLVRPFVAEQEYVVRVYRGRKKIRVITRKAKQPRGAAYGVFSARIKSRRAGRLTITASHAETPEQATLQAKPLRVRVYRTRLRFGARGPVVRLLQARLASLHFAVSRSGRLDDATARAVLAYRKTNGLPRTSAVSRRVLDGLLAGRGAFRPRFPGHGKHVEADLSRQVLALINPGGKVFRTYHTSSGKPSTPTILGSFRFYSQTPGTNAKGMLDSNYFIRGYAIHGYPEVPVYAASHGCLRIPNANAAFVMSWIGIGDGIDVYP